jgi:DNA-binding beta-propeller fold protein YncE
MKGVIVFQLPRTITAAVRSALSGRGVILAVLLAIHGLTACAPAQPPRQPLPLIFYPPPPQQPRLQFLHTISSEADLGRRRSAFNTFLLGQAPAGAMIGRPYDIASSPGRIYVLDRLSKKLRIIDLAARRIDDLADEGPGALQDPSGIWVTSGGDKYIADMQRRQVVVFDAHNHFLRAYGGRDDFERPVDVAVYQDRIYVCDAKRHAVAVLDRPSGRLINPIGGQGADPGQFRMPTHCVVDGQGRLWVTDAFNARIQNFTPQGIFENAYGYLGDTPGAFARPKGLAVDRSGHLYVADAAFENVQIFDVQSGNLLLFFGGPGTAPGNMYLPAGIHIDYDNAQYFANFADPEFELEYVIYVANTFGPNRINVYGFGKLRGQAE